MSNEVFGPDKQKELRELRKLQLRDGVEPLDEKTVLRIRELTALEEASKRGVRPLSEEEKRILSQLSIENMGTKQKDWTPEKSKQFLELRKRAGWK